VCIPLGLHGNWAILLVTAAGTLLALLTGALPQWREEKYACRRNRKKVVVLTGGNGTRNVMVVIDSHGKGLDLEDLAAAESPRLRRVDGETNIILGHPLRLLLTQVASILLSVLWILVLITVTALNQDPWYLLAIGGLGMVQNVVAAGARRDNGTSGIHLDKIESFKQSKVMDALMDSESAYAGVGRVLLEEFFPNGSLRLPERQWWEGNRSAYEEHRQKTREDSLENNEVTEQASALRKEYETLHIKSKSQ